MKTRNPNDLKPLLDDFVNKIENRYGEILDKRENQKENIRFGGYVHFYFGSIGIHVRVHNDYGQYFGRVHVDVGYRQKTWTSISEGKDYSDFLDKIGQFIEDEKISNKTEDMRKSEKNRGEDVLEKLGLVSGNFFTNGDFKVEPYIANGEKYRKTKYLFERNLYLQNLTPDQFESFLELLKMAHEGTVKVSLKFEEDQLENTVEFVERLKTKK